MENTKGIVAIPQSLALATVIDSKPAEVRFGEQLVPFEHKGKSYVLDTAVVVGGGTKRLMSLAVFCKLHGVSKSENPEAFKKLSTEYNRQHKPAFWAWFNAGLDVARKEMQPNSLGFRQRLDGSVRATFGFVAPVPEKGSSAKSAGRFIANGKAKAEKQSKGKAKRQSKGKPAVGTPEANAAMNKLADSIGAAVGAEISSASK